MCVAEFNAWPRYVYCEGTAHSTQNEWFVVKAHSSYSWTQTCEPADKVYDIQGISWLFIHTNQTELSLSKITLTPTPLLNVHWSIAVFFFKWEWINHQWLY